MKKILFSLLCLIGLSSFCSAGTYTYNFNIPAGNYPSLGILASLPYPVSSDYIHQTHYTFDYDCIFGQFDGTYTNGEYMAFGFGYTNSYPGYVSTFPNGIARNSIQSVLYSDILSFSGSSLSGHYYNSDNYPDEHFFSFFLFVNQSSKTLVLNKKLSVSCTFSGESIINVGGNCPECPNQFTSEECQTEYDLVPSSDLSICNNNLQSCQTSLSGRNNTLNNCSNNLLSCESSLASCIQSNCPIDTGDVMWSSIWINGIQHLGKPVINIDIPDQIYRQYTTDDEEFNLYVGTGYDQEYIDNVIAINSYHPTSEDFTSVFVGGLTLIMPYIFIALLILFIRKLVKRIFK